uniref:Uncharacterized protein n=1 Tax=Chromera velia CCMP2878 TaxID=1169474 RepID=A0A0G4F9C8_9ALVE|eukprot:Cvel_15883.t1-p1 / transcript=Cvel_15883.t1 / gene=Cvel_15883 / organism=Chromera_velia_CCMP2878 / gene_product=hypothetical protein / transcript_product=hypothetical protein / location=Cvel_scaffold1199:228-801(+) / protein_length=81 / sequence_SO=supercontig / SO=protein_coding / is_pseudo=false
MGGDSPGGSDSPAVGLLPPPAQPLSSLGVAMQNMAAQAAAVSARAQEEAQHPHGIHPHLTGQRNLVHSPFLKTRSPGGRSW